MRIEPHAVRQLPHHRQLKRPDCLNGFKVSFVLRDYNRSNRPGGQRNQYIIHQAVSAGHRITLRFLKADATPRLRLRRSKPWEQNPPNFGERGCYFSDKPAVSNRECPCRQHHYYDRAKILYGIALEKDGFVLTFVNPIDDDPCILA